MFGWLFGKKRVKEIKDDTKRSFDSVKKDMSVVTEWIKHLDSEKNTQKGDIEDMKEDLSTMKEEIEGLKNIISVINSAGVFKTPRRVHDKQTAVYAVQTAVQTPNLDQFSVTERAILWVLLNSDLKLSYDDLAAMLGKERTTIRGQINAIKQKSESLIEEVVEKNGKKRVFIPENMKEKLLKKTKVRVRNSKKDEKRERNRVSEY